MNGMNGTNGIDGVNGVVLLDDGRGHFGPLTDLRSTADLRSGMLTTGARLLHDAGLPLAGLRVRRGMLVQFLRDVRVRLFQVLPQLIKHGLVRISKKGRGDAVLARATRPADAVRVVLDLQRHVVIDHMSDIWNIQASSRHVRRDQDPERAALVIF